ncbi:MAG: hypothetical protein R3B09_35965 [Nannocystaceae bacterium]
MLFEALNLLAGRQHQLSVIVLMRGETYMETIEDGGSAVILVLRGAASISRQRAGAQAGLHITPRVGEPVWLTIAGTYCVTARAPMLGLRMVRLGGGAAKAP